MTAWMALPHDAGKVSAHDSCNLTVVKWAESTSIRDDKAVNYDPLLRTSCAGTRLDVVRSRFRKSQAPWHSADLCQFIRDPDVIVFDEGEAGAEFSAGGKGQFLNAGGLTCCGCERRLRRWRSCSMQALQARLPSWSSLRASSRVLIVKPTRSLYLLATLAAGHVARV
jgi:hypothetical protein